MLVGIEFGRRELGHVWMSGANRSLEYVGYRKWSRKTNSSSMHDASRALARLRLRHVKLDQLLWRSFVTFSYHHHLPDFLPLPCRTDMSMRLSQ